MLLCVALSLLQWLAVRLWLAPMCFYAWPPCASMRDSHVLLCVALSLLQWLTLLVLQWLALPVSLL